MSRGEKLIAMVLASKDSEKNKETGYDIGIMSPCSSKQAMEMDLKSKLRSTESRSFQSTVLQEKAACSQIGNIEEIKILDSEISPQNSTSCNEKHILEDGVVFDDSDADPNYVPTDEENNSDASVESSLSVIIMATQLERNLSECDIPHKIRKREITKKRNLGQEYFNHKGKLVKARNVKPLDVSCKLKCSTKITPQNQTSIFTDYWGLASYNMRQSYISGMIEIVPKKTETLIKSISGQRNRVYSYNYFVEVETNRIRVCHKCFLRIFDETPGFIKTVIQRKIDSAGIVLPSDKRGRHAPANKISQEKYDEVLNHINSFPHYESHYTRRHTQQKYLQSDLSISVLYKLYTEKYRNPISITKYAEIFKTLNLKFKKPQLDRCNKCELLEMQIKSSENEDVKSKLLEEKIKHLERADTAYESKRADQLHAKANRSIKTYTFDLQQCLPTPLLCTSISFYKRQLWTFNLTLHDAQLNRAHNMMWHEADGNRGGNEIASCLFQHLSNISSDVKHIILYSDSCAGQNKNSFVTTMFQVLIQTIPHLEKIDHKFLVPVTPIWSVIQCMR